MRMLMIFGVLSLLLAGCAEPVARPTPAPVHYSADDLRLMGLDEGDIEAGRRRAEAGQADARRRAGADSRCRAQAAQASAQPLGAVGVILDPFSRQAIYARNYQDCMTGEGY